MKIANPAAENTHSGFRTGQKPATAPVYWAKFSAIAVAATQAGENGTVATHPYDIGFDFRKCFIEAHGGRLGRRRAFSVAALETCDLCRAVLDHGRVVDQNQRG